MAQLVTNPLWVTWDDEKEAWITGFPWVCTIEDLSIFIPIGFQTDLASIPRALWWIHGFSPQELGLAGPVVHDWLYQNGGYVQQEDGSLIDVTRKQVDGIFKLLMQRSRVGGFRRNAAWLAVRWFGWFAWHRTERSRDASPLPAIGVSS